MKARSLQLRGSAPVAIIESFSLIWALAHLRGLLLGPTADGSYDAGAVEGGGRVPLAVVVAIKLRQGNP